MGYVVDEIFYEEISYKIFAFYYIAYFANTVEDFCECSKTLD